MLEICRPSDLLIPEPHWRETAALRMKGCGGCPEVRNTNLTNPVPEQMCKTRQHGETHVWLQVCLWMLLVLRCWQELPFLPTDTNKAVVAVHVSDALALSGSRATGPHRARGGRWTYN